MQRITLSSAVAFSKDGKSIWIARPAENVRKRFTLAVQLDAHSLGVIDHYDIDPPIAGNRTAASRTTIESTPDGPRLTALVNSYTGIKNVFQGDTAHYFAYGVDLTDKADLFPHFQLVEDDTPFRDPWRILLSLDVAVAVVPLWKFSNPKIVPNIQQDRDVDVYGTQTGRRISFFDSTKTLDDEQTTEEFFGRTGADLIATSHRRSDQAPGLIVYDVKSGTLVQCITGPDLGGLAFSLDRKRMVGSLSPYAPGMQFFSVNR